MLLQHRAVLIWGLQPEQTALCLAMLPEVEDRQQSSGPDRGGEMAQRGAAMTRAAAARTVERW